jgi:hypothetical protein
MGQMGFFDVERRLEAISAKGEPLEAIKKIVPWDNFRADIEAVTETKPEERKSNAGRKRYDAILKFKIVCCSRCTISLMSRPSTCRVLAKYQMSPSGAAELPSSMVIREGELKLERGCLDQSKNASRGIRE